ncbi:MAG: FAD-dependent thymidylate synthase [Lachnospiraceae bacterium]|nr:FAD-dependent thymidylate synthase [Lachnospiraceae bacterium]
MKVTINSITGFDDAFVAMYISKRSWTPKLDAEIRDVCDSVLDKRGRVISDCNSEKLEKFNKWLSMLLRMGRKHITVLRYIEISIMTEGIHRGGQDDIDAHVKRFENKIIRSSTRLAEFEEDEMSDYYKDKIITTDKALRILGVYIPQEIEYKGCKYVKSPNGYVKEEYKNNKDVKRGLYMLSIPSNFVSKINLCEWGHVFKERNKNGGANPEVKEWAEMVMEQITEYQNQITRDYVLTIEN